MFDYPAKLTKGEVKMVGEQRWQKAHKWRIIIYGLCVLAAIVIPGLIWPATLWASWLAIGIGVVGAFSVLVYIWIATSRAGKTFLAEVEKENAKTD